MPLQTPHRRLNPLTREWVLVSPQRTQRPWQGQIEQVSLETLPMYDPTCYLCPGNERAGGKRNPLYTGTFVFENDYPSLNAPSSTPEKDDNSVASNQTGLIVAQPESGVCRVVCFSPRHDMSLPELSQTEVEAVIQTWSEQTQLLVNLGFISYVQVFENKGAIMGASNPHPHSQIWATSHIPNEPMKELIAQSRFWQENKACLLCSYLEAEQVRAERIVVSNDHFTALVPFWAIWPYEMLLLPHRHVDNLENLNSREVASLADIIRRLTARYDNLFETSFPYSMGFHQIPVKSQQIDESVALIHSKSLNKQGFTQSNTPFAEMKEAWHLHAHYYPPLLRSATVRKFMVGFEMLASPQRDLTPEYAAEQLRSLGDLHFRAG